MLRPILFAAAAIALVAPVRAAEPDFTGNWLFTYSSGGGIDQALLIVNVEMKNGKPVISTVFPTGPNAMSASGVVIENGKTIKFQLNKDFLVEGMIGSDGNITGSFTSDRFALRAKLTKTDKTEIANNERVIRSTPPAQAAESQKLSMAINQFRFQASREKDEEKKKELTEKANMAQKEFDDKQPGLLRELVAQNAGSPFAIDGGMELLRGAAKFKVTPDEAKKLLVGIEKAAIAYGPSYVRALDLQFLEALAYQKGLESIAASIGEKLTKAFTDSDSPAYQSQVLSAFKKALESTSLPNKEATLKTVSANLEKIEGKLDTEFLKTVPPFKPTTFVGRSDKTANQVVVMELFTGAQCPPCVAADVAFDALQKSYKPTELVLIQYHLHIPGPDPLTNPDNVARFDYYRKQFPMDVGGTPTTVFNGKPQAGGGGGMANAEGKFKQYTGIIDPLLEKTSEVKISGKANRTGDKVNVSVEVVGGDGDEMKLRLLVVEETIKYVGGNALRFHHQVVRAMPGGAGGVNIKDKTFKHSAAVDLVNVRKELAAYLDDYAKNATFPKPQRPMDLKSLRVIALVQNDKTKEILQTLQLEIENRSTAGSGGEE